MSRIRALAKGASIAGAASVVVGGTAYGLERFAVARLRRRPDSDPESVLAPVPYAALSIPSFDAGTLSYIDTGAGTKCATFVLSHGVTLSVRAWVRQISWLKTAGFRVVAFDHRGHGRSSLGTTGFGVDQIGDDIDTLLRTLDLSNVVLVGHSMGGIAAQSYLARHASDAIRRIDGLVLLSSLPSALHGSQAARVSKTVEQVTRRTPDSTRVWSNPHLGLLLARFGFGRDPRVSDIELVRQMMHACDRRTRVEGPRSLIGFSLVTHLADIRVPTLVIGGSADAITPERDARRMFEAIPNARLEIFEGGGHMLMLERYETLNSMLAEFAETVSVDRESVVRDDKK